MVFCGGDVTCSPSNLFSGVKRCERFLEACVYEYILIPSPYLPHGTCRARLPIQDSTGIDFWDTADGIAMGEDASVVVVGGTGGAWDIPNIGGWDMAAFKLDANGTLLWKWQVTSVSGRVLTRHLWLFDVHKLH